MALTLMLMAPTFMLIALAFTLMALKFMLMGLWRTLFRGRRDGTISALPGNCYIILLLSLMVTCWAFYPPPRASPWRSCTSNETQTSSFMVSGR